MRIIKANSATEAHIGHFVRQDRTKIEEQDRDHDKTSNEAFFALIHTDRRHARTFTLSGWRRRPRNLIFLDGGGRQTALAVGTPAATMVVLLLVSVVTVSISAISILIPPIAIIPVTTITISVSVALPLAPVTVPLAIAITVAATATTRAAGAFSAWWR